MEQISDQEISPRYWAAHSQVSDLNFATRRQTFTMQDPGSSQVYMDLALQPFLHNMAIMEAGDSLAMYQVRNPYDLFASSLEARLRTVMDSNGPYVKPPVGMGLERAISLNWADVVRETKLQDFRQRADGAYYCLFRTEHFIVISEQDFEVLSILQRFLEPWPPWPHPDDVDKEIMVVAIELEKAVRFKEAHAEIGDRLDSYVAKLKEREDNLAVYKDAIEDWSKLYFGQSFGLPPSMQPSPTHSVDTLNSIEHDPRGDIEYLLPENEVSTEASAGESVSEPPRRRSHARKPKPALATAASESALSSIPDSDWEPLDDYKGSDGDDDDESDVKKTPTKAPLSSPYPKRRRVTENSSLQMGVRTRLTQDEKDHGFILINSMLKAGESWVSIANRYNNVFGTHRSAESARAVWDRLSLNPKSTEAATVMASYIEPVSRETSSNNTIIPSTPGFVSSSTASPKKRYGHGNVKVFSARDQQRAADKHDGDEKGRQYKEGDKKNDGTAPP